MAVRSTASQASPADVKANILKGQLTPDMNFHQKVWALTSRIPRGSVTTYAAIADALGTKAYRAVGQALHHNPYAPQVPCHRVVGSTGKLTGYAHGIPQKADMLRKEGLDVKHERIDLAAAGIHDVSKAPARSR